MGEGSDNDRRSESGARKNGGDEIDLLVEIASCRGLLVGDFRSSDPYVKVKLGGADVHETKHISSTLDPVFTSDYDPTFPLSVRKKELTEKGGLYFKVKDYDPGRSNDELGGVLVSAEDLLSPAAAAGAVEYKLDPPKGKKGKDAGYISIRCKASSRPKEHSKDAVPSVTCRSGTELEEIPSPHSVPSQAGSSESHGAEETQVSEEDFTGEVQEKDTPVKGGASDEGWEGPRPGEGLELLVEIVSCWDLLAGDFKSSDPYVKVKLGGTYVHETKYISETLDPVFTIIHDSMFILTVSAKELFDSDGLLFTVKDHDVGLSNDELGKVRVQAKVLYEAAGERLEYALDPPKRMKNKNAGYIAIRCKRADEYDKKFIEGVKNEKDAKSFLGLESSMQKLVKPSRSGGLGSAMVRSNTRTEKSGAEKGIKKYRVRPRPDPKREKETEWMSEGQIEAECMEKSVSWLDLGSGDLGRVFVEVIGADGLPNKDSGVGLFGSNKSDPFVSIVFEDTMAKTDVVDDCLSPRWLPWMQRAFVFRIMNTSSKLLVGVFDCDQGIGNEHDFIGRVSIGLSNLRTGTEYFLKYKLRESSNRSEGKGVGSITIRLKIEIEDERKALLSSFQAPPVLYVNVRGKDDFRVVRKTCFGKHDEDLYSTNTISAHVEELRSYKYMMYYINDAVISLIFWRGHFPLSFRIPGRAAVKADEEEKAGFLHSYTNRFTVFLPLHSFNAFVIAVLLAERPSLAPSFFFLGIGWLLLAVMGYRRRSPNPWSRCKSFGEFVQTLVFGECMTYPPSIAKNENEEQVKAFEEKWERRIEAAEAAAARKNEERMQELKEHEELMAEIGGTGIETDLSTKMDGGTSFDPLKPILFPIQQYLGKTCDAVRFCRNVICWEEPYYSFWLAAASLALGFIFFFVPWAFLFQWLSRLVAWSCFGPWMKLVDILWYRKRHEPTEEELKQRKEEEKKAKIESAKAAAAEARARREEAAKLKDMKTMLYGSYMTKVPIIDLNRYPDVPLHSSIAKPCGEKDVALHVASNRKRIAGQRLVGNMVPKLKAHISDHLTNLEAKKSRRASRSSLGIALVLLVAAGIWYGAPFHSYKSGQLHLSDQTNWKGINATETVDHAPAKSAREHRSNVGDVSIRRDTKEESDENFSREKSKERAQKS